MPEQVEGSRRRRADGSWMSVSEASRALGVSPSTLRLWASEGRVPHVRTEGGHRRFDPEALREWLARQPARNSRPLPRPRSVVPVSTAVADALRRRIDLIGEHVDAYVEGPAEAAFRRLPAPERRAVVSGWIEALADAFETGSLAEAAERAEGYGHGHGLAGSSAEVTLGGSLALERAVEQALAQEPVLLDESDREQVGAAMSQLTVRVATSWAAAVASRARR